MPAPIAWMNAIPRKPVVVVVGSTICYSGRESIDVESDDGLVMDRHENSAINILMRYVAWFGPHTERISGQYADVFTAVNLF
jgi:hypothetical protein